MKTIVVAGLNHETINACIFLASLDWQVTLLASADTLNALLSGYRFDKQVILLWQLYVGEQKITLVDSALETYNKAQYYWLCFEALSSQDKKALPSLHFLPQSQVIITGAANVGVIDALAEQLTTPWVYYLPLIFMKEGANFNSFFHSDLIIIGEKTANSTHKSALLQFFISHSQKQRIANIKTIEFGRMAIMGMLATRLSYINEMARLADELAVDIWAIQAIMGADKRIGQDYLQAGWGLSLIHI